MGFTIVAKAGGSEEGAENTLEAFGSTLATELPGFATLAFEVDVRLSKDGVPFAIHDATLDRTTDARGPVEHLSARELRERRAGANGERVPMLAEIIELTRGHELVIEPHDERNGMLEALVATVARFSRSERDRLIVASECGPLIHALRARGLRTAATAGEAKLALLLERLRLDALVPLGHVWMLPETHRGITVITRRFVESVTRAGDPIWVYVVNDADHVERLRTLGVNGCFTTRPRQLCRELSSREPARPSE